MTFNDILILAPKVCEEQGILIWVLDALERG